MRVEERRFQLFDFGSLRGGQIAPAQFVAGISDSSSKTSRSWLVARFAADAGIVQLVSQSGRKFPEGGQSVALLLHARGFADPVGHQADQTLGQFRHFLDEFRE